MPSKKKLYEKLKEFAKNNSDAAIQLELLHKTLHEHKIVDVIQSEVCAEIIIQLIVMGETVKPDIKDEKMMVLWNLSEHYKKLLLAKKQKFIFLV